MLQILFTANEMELGFCNGIMNIKVASRISEQLKTYNLRKLESFKEIRKMLGIDVQVFSRPPKRKILTIVP